MPETPESQFFDAVYTRASGDEGEVPWQHALSRTFIGDWFDAFTPVPDQDALVVAAGLGDDAAALARMGLRVTAFDFSPTAVAWATERHAGVPVSWELADLFDLPAAWNERFDLVVEVFTIQSTPPPSQRAAATAIRRLVKPHGTLVAVALVHDGDGETDGPPWPLHRSTLDELGDGFRVSSRRVQELDHGLSCELVELERLGP